jgi:protein-disulfide isomerase
LLAGAGGLALAGLGMALTGLGAREPDEVVADAPREATALPTQAAVPTNPSDPTEKGSPDAPVRMIDFSSYTCSHCADFALETEPLLDDHYIAPGLMHFRFAHVAFSPFSQRASEAAECAGVQGAFWPYHHELMARQTVLYRAQYEDALLAEIAAGLELDADAFLADLTSGRCLPRVQAAHQEAVQRGIRATPTFLINEVKVLGARPFTEFQRIIDQELASSGHG